MTNKAIKEGAIIIKTLIYPNGDTDRMECELTFDNGGKIIYECYISELEDKPIGIYQLLSDGKYIQIENWGSKTMGE